MDLSFSLNGKFEPIPNIQCVIKLAPGSDIWNRSRSVVFPHVGVQNDKCRYPNDRTTSEVVRTVEGKLFLCPSQSQIQTLTL